MSARRIVMTGRTMRPHRTMLIEIDNRFGNHEEVVTAGLPGWFPKPPDNYTPEPDHDLIRKQRIEDAL